MVTVYKYFVHMEDSCSAKRVVLQLCDIVIRYVESRGAGVKSMGNVVKSSIGAIRQYARVPIGAEVFASADPYRTHSFLSDAF
jgi:hypothetical protein